MSKHEQVNYLEFPARDISATKQFFKSVFDWAFQDYGPEYCCVINANIDIGFYHAPLNSSTVNGSALVVFYSETLEQTQEKILGHGGTLVKQIFEFPGGRRFHFADPNGNEYAVWTDKGLEA